MNNNINILNKANTSQYSVLNMFLILTYTSACFIACNGLKLSWECLGGGEMGVYYSPSPFACGVLRDVFGFVLGV